MRKGSRRARAGGPDPGPAPSRRRLALLLPLALALGLAGLALLWAPGGDPHRDRPLPPAAPVSGEHVGAGPGRVGAGCT